MVVLSWIALALMLTLVTVGSGSLVLLWHARLSANGFVAQHPVISL